MGFSNSEYLCEHKFWKEKVHYKNVCAVLQEWAKAELNNADSTLKMDLKHI